MRFAAPAWLWLLLVLPVAYGILFLDDQLRQKRFELFARRSLWSTLAPELDPRSRMKKTLLWMLALAFATLALARPQWGTREETAKMSGLDVMVVLDISNSMETEDVVPSRLKKAKHLIRNMAEHLAGDRLGLVTFAGGASLVTPLTTDTEYFLETLSVQGPRMIPTQGTDIGLGLETATRALDRGAESTSGSSDSEVKPSRAIVLVTDGEDFEGMFKDAASKLKSQGIRLYAFGVGTEKGGPVPVRDDSGTLLNYKRDRSGQPVVSSFHPDDLIKLAATAGGRYWNVTSDENEVEDMLGDMGALSRGEFAEHHYLVYEERFQYPLAIAIFLLLWEISLSYRRRRSATAVALLAGMAALLPTGAQAGGMDTYVENKKGVEAYQQGKIEEAQKHFGAAQALDPSLPELHYNEGLVKMQRGDADAALHDFQEAARGAMKNNDSRLLGKTFFNLGSALSKKGDMKGAIQSYLAAINSAKESQDPRMEQDARKNLELLVQEQQKQKQQQQQQQNNQNQQQQQQQQQQNQQQQQQQNQGQGQGQQKQKNDGSGDQQDQKDKQDQGQDKDKKDQKDQNQQQQQQQQRYENSSSRGKKFESKKLTPEDAERVMAELKNRERDLQIRMKKKNGNHNANSKDW